MQEPPEDADDSQREDRQADRFVDLCLLKGGGAHRFAFGMKRFSQPQAETDLEHDEGGDQPMEHDRACRVTLIGFRAARHGVISRFGLNSL